MEGGRAKRQVNDEEEEEEEKINTFFSLIKNMQDVRNQMVNSSKENKPKEKEKEIMKSKGSPSLSFELEDFMKDGHFAAVLPSSSTKNEEQAKQEKQAGLDLNLSL